jgi:hypothetical protein
MASPKKKPKRGKVPMSKIPADPFVSIGAAFTALGDAGALLRRRLAEIDPLDHPASPRPSVWRR